MVVDIFPGPCLGRLSGPGPCPDSKRPRLCSWTTDLLPLTVLSLSPFLMMSHRPQWHESVFLCVPAFSACSFPWSLTLWEDQPRAPVKLFKFGSVCLICPGLQAPGLSSRNPTPCKPDAHDTSSLLGRIQNSGKALEIPDPINNSIRQLIKMRKCLTKQNHNRSCQK